MKALLITAVAVGAAIMLGGCPNKSPSLSPVRDPRRYRARRRLLQSQPLGL